MKVKHKNSKIFEVYNLNLHAICVQLCTVNSKVNTVRTCLRERIIIVGVE